MNLFTQDIIRPEFQLSMKKKRGTHIAAADTGISNIQKNIMGVLELGDRTIFKLDLTDALENKR